MFFSSFPLLLGPRGCRSEDNLLLSVAAHTALIAETASRVGEQVAVFTLRAPAECPGQEATLPEDLKKLAQADLLLLYACRDQGKAIRYKLERLIKAAGSKSL
jgi:hypothetical protein